MYEDAFDARILIIDDDDLVRRTLTTYLEDSGFTILEASNGEQGLETARREKPDLLLVDLRMPVMDGLSVLEHMHREDPEIPVIVVSGTSAINDVVQALRLGAWDYIIKPVVDMGLLEHSLYKALERARLKRENRLYRDHLEVEVHRRTEALRQTNEKLTEEIAERTRVEEEITRSLREKEILLKEIHHRVKNNLQIISSLLNLQSSKAEDEAARVLLDESRNRIHSMALLHEELYRSDDLSQVGIRDYLTRLSSRLSSSFASGKAISVDVDIQDIRLSIDTAIPLGLAVNELVSNALRHAFAGGENGSITVSITPGDMGLVLRVSDTGRGFPEQFDPANTTTLGFQLVHGLTSQLSGELSISPGPSGGSVVEIAFPLSGAIPQQTPS